MATWTAPTTRSTGDLISASIWNTDLTENLKYLKDAPVIDTAVIIGAATTSGIRLDLESGTLAVREGDDSAYGPINTGALTVATGRVLVGTTTARTLTTLDSLVQVETAGSTYQQLSLVANRNDTGGASIILGKSRGTTVGSNTVVADGDNLGFIRFNAADGVDMDSIAAQILAQVDGAPGSNDTPGRLIFSTAADGSASVTERMRIDSSGNVSIGSASAVGRLHVLSAATGTTAASNVVARVATNGTGYDAFVQFSDTVTNSGGVGMLSGNMYIYAGSAERLRITSGGNVAIGATAKLYLDGVAGTGDTYITEVASNTVDIYAGSHNFRLTSTNLTTYGDLIIAATKKLYFDGGGDTYIEETSANSATIYAGGVSYRWNTGAYFPTADNSQNCGSGSFRWAAVYAANGTIQTSDRTLKRDISTDTPGLGFLLRLRPVSFTMHDEADGVRRHGLIAQDVIDAAHDTSLVGILTGEKDGEYGLNYAGFVPALIKAVQEQQAEIAALKARLN